MFIMVEIKSHPPALLFHKSLAEIGSTPGDRILMRSMPHGLYSGLKHRRRRVGIRKPLGQINGIIPVCHPGHLPDNGFSKKVEMFSCCRHRLSK